MLNGSPVEDTQVQTTSVEKKYLWMVSLNTLPNSEKIYSGVFFDSNKAVLDMLDLILEENEKKIQAIGGDEGMVAPTEVDNWHISAVVLTLPKDVQESPSQTEKGYEKVKGGVKYSSPKDGMEYKIIGSHMFWCQESKEDACYSPYIPNNAPEVKAFYEIYDQLISTNTTNSINVAIRSDSYTNMSQRLKTPPKSNQQILEEFVTFLTSLHTENDFEEEIITNITSAAFENDIETLKGHLKSLEDVLPTRIINAVQYQQLFGTRNFSNNNTNSSANNSSWREMDTSMELSEHQVQPTRIVSSSSHTYKSQTPKILSDAEMLLNDFINVVNEQFHNDPHNETGQEIVAAAHLGEQKLQERFEFLDHANLEMEKVQKIKNSESYQKLISHWKATNSANNLGGESSSTNLTTSTAKRLSKDPKESFLKVSHRGHPFRMHNAATNTTTTATTMTMTTTTTTNTNTTTPHTVTLSNTPPSRSRTAAEIEEEKAEEKPNARGKYFKK